MAKIPDGPRVNLNTAGPDDLMRIEGIDDDRARLIVEHRRKRGPFRSWEELEEMPGIGPVLAQKIRRAATLGPETARSAEELGGIVEELDEIEVLTTLARLDLEAALAYDVAANASHERDLRQTLGRFRDDHLRHVDDLNRLLRGRGGPELGRSEKTELLLRPLARVAAAFGPIAVVMTLLNDEQITNETYELALELEWDDDVQRVLERNLSDEQRHLSWLAEKEDQLVEQGAPMPAPP